MRNRDKNLLFCWEYTTTL